MTKKSKGKNKVTSSIAAIETNTEDKDVSKLSGAGTTAATSPHLPPPLKNGKIAAETDLITSTSNLSTTSLASVPGIVDAFLAPKFVKVLQLSDHGFEKIPPPDLADYKARGRLTKDSNANNNVDDSSSSSSQKKSRRKGKPKKNTNLNVTYDSEDAQELETLSLTENGNCYPETIVGHLKSELCREDAEKLARLERIRNSSLQYEGNNIVIVSNLVDGPPLLPEHDPQYQTSGYPTASSSCYDDYNYDYEAEDVAASGGGPGSASAPSDETSILGLDLENEDDEDERVGSWSLSHTVDYCYPPKPHAPSSVASSESENNASSSSTTASGSTTKCYPALQSCSTIWDGVIHLCEIKDCSKPANKKCSQCKQAFYCGEDHQKVDWKRHKHECSPYRMERHSQWSGDDVSIAVAARNIPAGQTVFSEKPLLVFPVADPSNDFLHVMNLPCVKNQFAQDKQGQGSSGSASDESTSCCSAMKPACFGCLRAIEFVGPPRYKCNKCCLPLCAYNCQMLLGHVMGECPAIEAQGGWNDEEQRCYHTMYMDVEILRALQLQDYDHLQWERFLQMKQNLRVESYKESSRFRRFIRNYKELVPISAKVTGYNDDLIGNVHAIITALSFRPSLNSPCKLLFATQILFAHDCIPNTFHFFEESQTGVVQGMKLVTKAAVPICKKELITIDFSPTPFLYYPLRRMVLRNVLSIENCTCKRCRNASSMGDLTGDIKCSRCRFGLICAEKPSKWKDSVWACSSCLEECSYSQVVKITDDCRTEVASILTQPKHEVVGALVQFIERTENHTLSHGHSIILQAWCFIEAQLRSSLAATRLPSISHVYPDKVLDEYRLLNRCCDALERHLQVVRPGICYERGCCLFNRYYVNIAIAAKRYGLRVLKRKEYIQELLQSYKLLQEALKIFQVYDGYNRDVRLHIQEATAAVVNTKNYIQELMVTDSEEQKVAALAFKEAS